MAGLWADNPDYYTLAQLGRVWTSLTGTNPGACTIASGLGRRAGTNALQFANTFGVPAAFTNCFLQKTLTPGSATIIHAFAIYFYDYAQVGTTEMPFWSVGDASVWHVGLAMRADHTLSFMRGPSLGNANSGTVIATAPTPLSVNTWYHFSIKCKIDDAVGSLSFKLNRIEQLNGGLGYTNIDTRNAGSAGWSRIGFTSSKPSVADPASNPAFRLCDQVVCDDTGARNNDHPGDCSVLVQLPSLGNGGNVDWTPLSGTDHGAMVREATPDDDTTYNQGSASGQRDTYVYPALPVVLGTPRFVITRPCVKLTNPGSTNVLDVVRKGGTNYDGVNPAAPTSGSYAYVDFLRELDPATGAAWTIPGINAAELGVKVQ